MIDSKIKLADLTRMAQNTIVAHLGIEFTGLGKDYIEATMPADHRTFQPLGLIHGGANAVLAETLGSMASYLTLDRGKFFSVGLEIKCNHIRAVRKGHVHGKATPIHIGKQTHVWKIEIKNDEDKLTCFSTITMAVLPVREKLSLKEDYPYPRG